MPHLNEPPLSPEEELEFGPVDVEASNALRAAMGLPAHPSVHEAIAALRRRGYAIVKVSA